MEMITVKEAASKLGVSSTRIRAMLADGLLAGLKDDHGEWRISSETLRAQREAYGQPSAKLRLQVFIRDGRKCRKAGCPNDYTGIHALHAHHIVPRSKGGTNSLDNLITLCCLCHANIHGDLRRAENSTLQMSEETRKRVKRIAAGLQMNMPDTLDFMMEAFLRHHAARGEQWAQEGLEDKALYPTLKALAEARGGTSSETASTLEAPGPAQMAGPGAVTCSCLHCGQSYQSDRRGSLCQECFMTGHRGDTRDCEGCNTAVAL